MSGTEFDRKEHWENAYSDKQPGETSWYQANPELSLSMISNAQPDFQAPVIDIGGGASLLVDHMLDLGYRDLTVLDISEKALHHARQRLGQRSALVQWIEADVTRFRPGRKYNLWHDRAAFHFLADAEDRAGYVRVLKNSLISGGQVIIATFALDGPKRCSGLDIVRYDARKLCGVLGPEFVLEEQAEETHITPARREQKFGFYRFRRSA